MDGPALPKGLPGYGTLRCEERRGEQVLSFENGAGKGRIVKQEKRGIMAG